MKTQANATPSLRFPGFEGAWKSSTIDEIANFRRGSFPQPYGLKKWYDDENGFPFIQVFDVGDDLRLKDRTKRLISDAARDLSVFVPKGSVVLTIQGSIGRIAVTQYDACCDRTLLIFTEFKVPLAEMYFVYALFLRFEIEERTAVGGTIKTITKEKLRVFPIGLPTLPEQQKIADFLTAVDGRIQQLSQKKALLQDYKKGVMQQLFTQALRFKDDHGNDFPEWEEKKLGEVASFHRGSALAKADLDENGQFECIHYGELFTRYREVIRKVTSRTNIVGGSRSHAGDILMPSSDVTPDGLAKASSLTTAGVTLGGDINVIRPVKGMDSEFLSYLINFQKNAIIRLVTGTTVKHLYNRDLATLLFTLPSSPPEQTKIADFLSAIDRKIESVASQINETQTFKRGLLQQMIV